MSEVLTMSDSLRESSDIVFYIVGEVRQNYWKNDERTVAAEKYEIIC